ncbi:hypothetical protein FCR2A7T_26790 [Flavobacterium cauense R2A-7]|uniref:Lipoprotein n=1 Tax=Flavobacterium cauense R2A-7 TaxID=1341154 RepID=V6S4G5_9FLAO|nr:hypothetical protein [Flavobacterium cauense]ESU19255.1 hypothetical protein FCR2A7T_26790 [Flavobacterium cauense R2A-7]KGO82127.1 hypothetical protein Q762_05380 [Flavobacterium cauense R2A-7]TWI15077.1 hypothetical protein IP98_00061 [Flavobacterium cauense R2A-7]
MKKITTLLLLSIFVYSCGVKQTQSMLSDGDYDGAINRAAEGLKTNKNAKGKQDYVYLMEEAFAKAKERDLRNIDMLAKDANPANFEKVYNTYLQLNNRQEKIRPLLPLKLLKQGRDAYFPFEDYSTQIVNSKNALSKYLYDNSKLLLKTNDKMSYRRAYDDFAYLESINPGYKDVKQLMDEAQFKGTDFVNVFTKNETNMVIPTRLQNDLLDFSTFGLNDKWTVYHNNRQKGVTYDYGLIVNFRQINISPEQIKEKEFIKEKQVKDGTKTLVDANGNVVKDSLGHPIKVDNFKTIRANIYEFRQFKACQVTAKVDYVDFRTNQLIETFPLTSEFNFEYIYANYNGDKRACDDNYLMYFDRRAVPFPSNEQMVFDTGEDLKAKLKAIITRNKFRR